MTMTNMRERCGKQNKFGKKWNLVKNKTNPKNFTPVYIIESF